MKFIKYLTFALLFAGTQARATELMVKNNTNHTFELAIAGVDHDIRLDAGATNGFKHVLWGAIENIKVGPKSSDGSLKDLLEGVYVPGTHKWEWELNSFGSSITLEKFNQITNVKVNQEYPYEIIVLSGKGGDKFAVEVFAIWTYDAAEQRWKNLDFVKKIQG